MFSGERDKYGLIENAVPTCYIEFSYPGHTRMCRDLLWRALEVDRWDKRQRTTKRRGCVRTIIQSGKAPHAGSVQDGR